MIVGPIPTFLVACFGGMLVELLKLYQLASLSTCLLIRGIRFIGFSRRLWSSPAAV